MKKILLYFCGITLFCSDFSGFGQESVLFKPTLWLSNPQKPNDTLPEFNVLNFHKHFSSGSNSFSGSSKRINNAQHLFLVYKSREEENIVSFIGKESAVFLEGKKLFLNDSVDLNGYNESYGELIDIQFSNIENGTFWMNPELKNSHIFELLLIDKKSSFEINEVRTYLGVKYGINLIDYEQYTYNNRKLWDGSEKTFNNQIFGLVSMGKFNLIPSKSMHSKEGDLIVSVSKTRQKQMHDGAYILFGSNRKYFEFDSKTKINRKQWLVQTNKEKLVVDISIPLRKLNQSKDTFNEYELMVENGNRDVQKYTARTSDTLLVFKNVFFGSDSHSKVSLKEYKSDVKFEAQTNCNELQIKIDDVYKLYNFKLLITDSSGQNLLTTTSPQKVFTISNTTSPYFDLIIEYNNKKASKRITSSSAALRAGDLQKYYTITNETLEIHLKNADNFTYEWFSNQNTLGKGNNISITKEGNYTLNISNRQGCTISQNFNVIKGFENEQWQVFPSPANVSEDVYVSFELPEKANVDIAVYQVNGKLVKTLHVGTIQNQVINLRQFAGSEGVYMVVAYIDGVPQIKKIIIK